MRIDFSGFVYLNFPYKFIGYPATAPLYAQDFTCKSSFLTNNRDSTGIVLKRPTCGIRKHALKTFITSARPEMRFFLLNRGAGKILPQTYI